MKIIKLSKRVFFALAILFTCTFFIFLSEVHAVFYQLITPEQLQDSGLRIVWQHKLPIVEAERLKQIFIIDNRIYVLTDFNYIFALDRDNGSPMFNRQFIETGLPMQGLAVQNNMLFFIAGNKLIEADVETGEKISSKELEFGITCPAARNNSFFYIAGTDKRLHALRAEDRVKIFKVAAENESVITSILAEEDFVYFSTDAGNVICITSSGPKRLWEFKAGGAVIGPIVKDGDAIYFASKDTHVYRINSLTGKFEWKYATGQLLDKGLTVAKNAVYQNIPEKGLVAISKKQGKIIWQLSEGVDLLAELESKAYILTSSSKIAVMDNEKAQRIHIVHVPLVSRHISNLVDSKMYLADESGRISCLEPIK